MVGFSCNKKEDMNALVLFGILLAGFVVYFLVRDKFFEVPSDVPEKFQLPAPAPIEIRQAPLYPSRVAVPSGPNPPSQNDNDVVVFGEPHATDPYNEMHENSNIPERLRNPENSFRPAPPQNQHEVAVQSGVAANHIQTSSDNSQQFSEEFIQNLAEYKDEFSNRKKEVIPEELKSWGIYSD